MTGDPAKGEQMISVISQGHYQITTSGGATVGKVDGDYVVGFQTSTADGHKLGPFPTLDEALKALNTENARPARDGEAPPATRTRSGSQAGALRSDMVTGDGARGWRRPCG